MKCVMRGFSALCVGLSALTGLLSSPAQAYIFPIFVDVKPRQVGIQCVPYARRLTGIRIFGDAWTWWDQAEGRYARGTRPRIGAIMALKPYGPMQLGHVAMVSQILDDRTVLLRHANWSPINGVRGQIEDNVRAVDVSPGNDWSAVRVWFAPLQNLGTTHWPVQGFIYKSAPRGQRAELAGQFANDPIGAIIARAHLLAANRKLASDHETGRRRNALAMASASGKPISGSVRARQAGRP